MLPGKRQDQVLASSDLTAAQVVLRDVILESVPAEGGPPKQFAKYVTIVKHTALEVQCKFDLRHGGKEVQMKAAYARQLTADYCDQDAPGTQDWTLQGLRKTF